MDIGEAQQKALKLVRLAASAPDSEEGRTAAATACKLIAEHGLLIMKPMDLVQVPFIPPAPAPVVEASTPATKKRRKRANAKAIRETMTTAADTAATALDAGSRVARAFNGLRDAIRGGG